MERRTWGMGVAAAAAGLIAACKRNEEPLLSATEVIAPWRAALPVNPDDDGWKVIPRHRPELLLQDMVDPRLMVASTKAVEVQAAHDTRRLAVRLQWEAADKHDLPGSARFADACAIQLPARIGAQLPAPQMGDAKDPVQISFWSAFWQATVDGRPDTINAIYPGARVDHYPFEAASLKSGSREQQAMERRYAPARALGNRMAGPRKQPVEDLVADGPGTLRSAQHVRSAGAGRHVDGKWRVAIHRPLPPGLGPGGQSHLAVAIWQGARQEVGARKMRSVWIPLSLGAAK